VGCCFVDGAVPKAGFRWVWFASLAAWVHHVSANCECCAPVQLTSTTYCVIDLELAVPLNTVPEIQPESSKSRAHGFKA
jgi:hypothetical protein